jgi:hypothetical protein
LQDTNLIVEIAALTGLEVVSDSYLAEDSLADFLFVIIVFPALHSRDLVAIRARLWQGKARFDDRWFGR